jgi:putative CocE/NonD family hydrolase
VVQDCRGRYASEGDFYPWLNEENDGLDTMDWIAAQPWCNGRIGMFGDSYLGGVQYSVAAPGHRCLRTLNPRFIPGDYWHAFWRDGAFTLALTFSWLCLEVGARVSAASLLPIFDVGGLLRHLPLQDIDEVMGCGVLPAWRDYINHETRDEYWQQLDYRKSMAQVKVPMLFTAGWYDYYPNDALLDYVATQQSPVDPAVAASHRLIMGPWTHGMNLVSELGELDYGPAALAENDSTTRWLECLLKDGKASDFQQAPIRLFVMGINEWRDEYEWPLQRTQFTQYYLLANGVLSRTAPESEQPDLYTYDPDNPVLTRGGNHSVGPYNPGLYELALPGPYDQRSIEERDDVLTYTTDVLEEDTEITGPVMMKLFAASSAPDTDFVARLCDVYPDGRSINITEGVIRARFRNDWSKTELLEPGRVYEYTIDLQATANVFLKGHRIRVDVTSSNFPLWDRNLNTGASIATGTEMQSAELAIHHDSAHP